VPKSGAHLTHDRLQLRTDTSSSSEYVRASERTLPALPGPPQLFVGLRSGLLCGEASPSGQGSISGASDPGGARFSLPPEGDDTKTSRQASSLASKLVFEAAPESWSRRRLTRWKTPPALALRRRRLPDSGMLGFWENSHACSCSRKHVSLPARHGNYRRSVLCGGKMPAMCASTGAGLPQATPRKQLPDGWRERSLQALEQWGTHWAR